MIWRMLGGMKQCFQKACALWKSDKDGFLVFGMFALGIIGMLYVVIEIREASIFTVDPIALTEERKAKEEAKYVATSLRMAPFAMPVVSEPVFPDRDCIITDFGAVSGGTVSNTESFRKAVNHCAEANGGRVVVPKGIWKTGPIHLKSQINLHLEKGARVVFSDDVKEYLSAVFSRFEGIELYNYSPFIYAKGCKNIALTGEGELDGNGKMWQNWNKIQEPSLQKLEKMADEGVSVLKRNFAVSEDTLQPSFIQFVECRGILIEGIKILNSPSWTIHPVYSENIIVRDIEVYTDARNTDGIAIDSSRNVVVQDSLFRAGDDAIVIKSGKDRDGLRVGRSSENIVVHDCIIEDGHGGIALGSEMSGGIRNVFAYNLTIVRADFGIRMKSMRGRGGIIENVFFEDIRIKKSVFDAIQMDMAYGTPLHKDDLTHSPVFRNISIKNVSVEWSKSPFFLQGLPESPIRNLSFENVKVSSIRNGKAIDVAGESYKNIQVKILE